MAWTYKSEEPNQGFVVHRHLSRRFIVNSRSKNFYTSDATLVSDGQATTPRHGSAFSCQVLDGRRHPPTAFQASSLAGTLCKLQHPC